MAVALLVLSFMSFRDAWRYSRTGAPASVTLQLPDSVKRMSRKVMRRGMGMTSMCLSGFIIGSSVTALESVCTGQIYVPTLVLVIRESAEQMNRAWTYLLIYNVMFVVPVFVVFCVTYYGVRTDKLIGWSKSNVPVSKVCLGILLLALAVFIALQ